LKTFLAHTFCNKHSIIISSTKLTVGYDLKRNFAWTFYFRTRSITDASKFEKLAPFKYFFWLHPYHQRLTQLSTTRYEYRYRYSFICQGTSTRRQSSSRPLRSSSQAATCYYQSNHSKVEVIPSSALPKDTTSESPSLYFYFYNGILSQPLVKNPK